jgi:hypothetical protein
MSIATLSSPSVALDVRRGARVLYATGDGETGVGYVEGESTWDGSWWFVFRCQDGSMGWCPQGLARVVAVDAGTHLVEDQFNNVGRLCNVRGDGATGSLNRCWQVAAAVSGGRYLVRHLDYGTVAVVGHRDMTNLY